MTYEDVTNSDGNVDRPVDNQSIETQSVDATSSSAQERIYSAPTGESRRRRLVGGLRDEDQTTTMDFDSGQLPPADIYTIEFSIGLHGTDGAPVYMRVNGQDSANYRQTLHSQGTFSYTQEETELTLYSGGDRTQISAEMTIPGPNIEAVGAYPVIAGPVAGHIRRETLWQGQYASGAPAESVQIWMGPDAGESDGVGKGVGAINIWAVDKP